jgi:hypothetical protein
LEFVSAIERRFGLIEMDLASTARHAKAGRFISPKQNSLKQDWAALLKGKMGYLNPPFDPITPWIDKCVEEAIKGARFLVLSQGSIDADWFWQMEPFCSSYALKGRLRFVGHEYVFPKPLLLNAFNVLPEPSQTIEYGHGLNRWHWRLDANGHE